MNDNTLNTFGSTSTGCWTFSGIVCPNCGGVDTEVNVMEVLTSLPPKFRYRCKCGHHWNSEEYNIGNLGGLVNPGPPAYGGQYGWICPKCGKVNAPHRDCCDCSGNPWTPVITCNADNKVK